MPERYPPVLKVKDKIDIQRQGRVRFMHHSPLVVEWDWIDLFLEPFERVDESRDFTFE
jgi:hypothetical protein